MKLKQIPLYLATLAVGISLVQPALAGTKIETTLNLPATMHGMITMEAHRAGPNIVIDTSMSLASLDMMLLFRKKAKSHESEIAEFGTNIALLPTIEQMVIPRSVAKGGVGKNPYVWVQFLDDHGNALTEEVYLGRYKKGLKLSPSFMSSIVASLDLESADCEKEHGKFYLMGNLTFGGIKARFTFKNKPTGKKILVQAIDLSLIAENSMLEMPVQGAHEKLGGNPFISLQFFQAGMPVTEEIPLGKCKDL